MVFLALLNSVLSFLLILVEQFAIYYLYIYYLLVKQEPKHFLYVGRTLSEVTRTAFLSTRYCLILFVSTLSPSV